MTNAMAPQTRTVLDGMRKELKRMEDRRDALWSEYQTAVQDCATMEQAIGVVQRRAGSGRGTLPTAAAAFPGSISFDGCGNAVERLVRMAESWGGTVNCADAADLLIRAGISKGSRSNLISALQKQLTDRHDLWEYVGPRTYRYLPYHNTKGSTGSGPE